MENSNQKMAVCRDFQTDSCKRETCKFAHIISSDPESFQSKPSSTRACLDFQKGQCMREVCKFAHVIIERSSEPKNTASSNACRAFQTNSCERGESCRFAHILVEDPSSLDVKRPRRRTYRKRPAGGAPREASATEEQSAPRQRGICRDFQKGNCERGAECKYRHEEKAPAQAAAPRGPKPVGACRDFQTGNCSRENCKFQHVIDANASQPRKRERSNKPCREFQTGTCTRGDACRYSHTTAEFTASA